MGFFNKIFGTKDDSVQGGTRGTDFVAALSMHLRGELDSALAAYLKMAELAPDLALPPFFAAAIKACKGEIPEAARNLRLLSQRISSMGENISRGVTLELVALVKEDPFIKMPAVADIVVSFGDDLKREGCIRESAVCFEIAAELLPDNAHVLHKLGDTLHDLRIYDYAESVLKEAIRQAPNHWGALYTYGVLLQDLGRDQEAMEFYERALKLNPEHANCQNNYGALLFRANRLDEALFHCKSAAALDPTAAFARVNLGNIYLLQRDFHAARASFTEAVSLNAGLAPAYYGLGTAEKLLGTGNERVKELFLKAIEINPAIAEIHHALASILAEEGHQEALAHFAAAARLDMNLKDLNRDFAAALLHLGHREEALERLKIAQEQDPGDPMVQQLLRAAEGAP